MSSSSLAPHSDSATNVDTAASTLSARAYVWMLAITVIGGLEIGLFFLDISPVLPLVREHYGASYVAAGWAISVTIVCHSLAVVLAGLVANRASPRVLLLSGLLLLLISAIMRAWAPTFVVLLVSRAVTGLGTGCLVTGGITAITHLSPPPRRVRDQGYFGAAQQLGIMVTSLVAPVVVHAYQMPVFWWLLAVQVGLVLVMCWLRYPRLHPQVVADARGARPLALLRDGYGWLLSIANMAGYAVFVGVTAWVASFLVERYHTSPTQTALLASAATLFAVVGRLVASPLLRVMSKRWLIGGFIALTAASLAALPFAPNQEVAALLLLVFAFASSAPFGLIFGSIADRPAPAGVARRVVLVVINSNIAALLLPLLIGYMVSLTHHFSSGFWLIAALTGLVAVVVLRSSLGRGPSEAVARESVAAV